MLQKIAITKIAKGLFDGVKRAIGFAPNGNLKDIRSVTENKKWNYPAVVAMAVRFALAGLLAWGAYELGVPLDKVVELFDIIVTSS